MTARIRSIDYEHDGHALRGELAGVHFLLAAPLGSAVVSGPYSEVNQSALSRGPCVLGPCVPFRGLKGGAEFKAVFLKGHSPRVQSEGLDKTKASLGIRHSLESWP